MTRSGPAPPGNPAPVVAAVRRFNRACRAASLLWLLVVIPVSLEHWPVWNCANFSQYYMGGLIARHRAWDSLYPIPNPHSLANPGDETESSMRPRYAQLAQEHGISNNDRFILLPPNALLFVPLTLVSYHRAWMGWTLLLILGGWGIGLIAGYSYEMLLGRPSRWNGGLALLIACSPLMFDAIRTANISEIMGFLLGFAVMQLIAGRQTGAAASIFLSGLIKYAGGILVPLALAMRRWSVILWLTAGSLAALGLSLAIMGTGPFRVYWTQIRPTLGRPSPFTSNQALRSFFLRVTHHDVLPASLSLSVSIVQLLILILLLLLIARRKRDDWKHPHLVLAAAAGLLAGLLIFSPIFWPEYYLYLCPWWGWLLWEARVSRARLVAVVIALALAIAPVTNWDCVTLREPLNSHMLASAVIVLALSIRRLSTSPQNQQTPRG